MLEEANGAGTVTLDGFFLVRGSLFVINRLFKDGTGTRQSRPLKREKERLKHERQYEDAPPVTNLVYYIIERPRAFGCYRNRRIFVTVLVLQSRQV